MSDRCRTHLTRSCTICLAAQQETPARDLRADVEALADEMARDSHSAYPDTYNPGLMSAYWRDRVRALLARHAAPVETPRRVANRIDVSYRPTPDVHEDLQREFGDLS